MKMPELAELRLTADYINFSTRGLNFIGVKKNPVHKCPEIKIPFEKFKIFAQSRGKELMLAFIDCNSDEKKFLSMTMGMSGRFVHTYNGHERKHSHLIFKSDRDTSLSFVDVRRFGKWKWASGWSLNRGPDPTTEYEKFCRNIIDNLHKSAFNHPIYTVLMNQKYFNGIGNYLRAEILYRLPHANPFKSAREILTKEPGVFKLCKNIPLQAYALGGGQLKDWENPFDDEPKSFKKFMRCYGNPEMSRKRDKNGRMFWYDPKWKEIKS